MKNKRKPSEGHFRIESNHALINPVWAKAGVNDIVVHDRSLAVAMAAKSTTFPCGGEVRVVHTPSGEVIFRKFNECDCGRTRQPNCQATSTRMQ